MEAETDEKVAEARKKQAEAAEAANRADIPKRKDAIASAEKQLAKLQVAKAQAEIEVMVMDAETRRLEATATG